MILRLEHYNFHYKLKGLISPNTKLFILPVTLLLQVVPRLRMGGIYLSFLLHFHGMVLY